MSFSRRRFLTTTALGSLVFGVKAKGIDDDPKGSEAKDTAAQSRSDSPSAKRPIIVSAYIGLPYLDRAYDRLVHGDDTLEAAILVVTGPEDDPNVDSVGLGGLPNEEGVVELDACCMHGPTRRGGAVGAVRNIRNVSKVSKAVMEHTGHVMLVGEGAERFAVAMGFARENLLTERSRKVWLLWKEFHSGRDWWGAGLSDPNWRQPDTKPPNSGPEHDKPKSELWRERVHQLEQRAADLGIEPEFRSQALRRVLFPPTGTIHCSVLSEKGEMSGVTTTSGLAFKLPGRCGDSPIIGAGCYTDQDVGSAGATGVGEENIKVAGAHTIVENMRRGMSPREAALDALKRIVRNYNGDMNKLRFLDMTYYVLRKDGAYAGVSLWEGYGEGTPHRIAVHDGSKRAENTESLLKGFSQSFPPALEIPPELKKDPKYSN